jgi:biopolymer transport protein ExbB
MTQNRQKRFAPRPAAGQFGVRLSLVTLLILFLLVAGTQSFSRAQDNGEDGGDILDEIATDVEATETEEAAEEDAPAEGDEQEDGASEGEVDQEETPQGDQNYLTWMFKSLGWFFSPIFLLLSLTMVALFVMNLMAIRRESLIPGPMLEQFQNLLDEKQYQEAYELAKEDESFTGLVLAAGLAKMSSGYEPAVQAMQDVGEEETMRLDHRLSYLALIGNISPMIGLFGTVVGMINSFNTIAVSAGAPQATELAKGISTALFTTMIGLAIAIPSIAAYDILKKRLARLVLEIGIISDNMMNRFSSVEDK